MTQVPIDKAVLSSEEASELDKHYIEGYRRRLEAPAWSTVAAKLLACRLKQDRW